MSPIVPGETGANDVPEVPLQVPTGSPNAAHKGPTNSDAKPSTSVKQRASLTVVEEGEQELGGTGTAPAIHSPE